MKFYFDTSVFGGFFDNRIQRGHNKTVQLIVDGSKLNNCKLKFKLVQGAARALYVHISKPLACHKKPYIPAAAS